MIDVVCAIIELQDQSGDLRVLAARRGPGMHLPGKWEFPGGKVAEGEEPEVALAREIREELALEVEVLHALPASAHHYEDKSIRLLPYLCRSESMLITPAEHDNVRWLRLEELRALEWAQADVPVLECYLARAQGT